MGHKASGQFVFADAWLGYNQKLNQQLNKIDQLVDWSRFQQLLSKIYASPTGRPSTPFQKFSEQFLRESARKSTIVKRTQTGLY